MGVKTFLSQKEARRLYVIEQVISGSLTIKQAAQLLGLSSRQVKRLKKGVTTHGGAFLAHKNRGRKPKHAIPQEVRDLVISLATDPGTFKNANCRHISELLAQYHGVSISARSIHRILTQAGIPLAHVNKHARRRRSRNRMPAFGMLVQIDASPFAWFESRGPWATLHGAIDDATGRVLGLYFRPAEDLMGHLHVLRQTTTGHGIPQAVYTDYHTIFFSPNKDKLSIEQELAGKIVPITQFGRALSELGITHIGARSPQAKGRIERLWQTLQSRLVIELRLAHISSIKQANAFLPDFISRFNERFAVDPAQPESAFRPCPPDEELSLVLCLKNPRKASNGSTISFRAKTYQLLTSSGQALPLHPKSTVMVLTHLDGSMSALYNDRHYTVAQCQNTPPNKTLQAKESKDIAPKHHTPPATHPWKRHTVIPKQSPTTSSRRDKAYWDARYAQR